MADVGHGTCSAEPATWVPPVPPWLGDLSTVALFAVEAPPAHRSRICGGGSEAGWVPAVTHVPRAGENNTLLFRGR